MGSASLFFALRPKNAILADINPDLVGTFLAVRDHPQAVANRLRRIPLGKRSFYSVRDSLHPDMDAIDAAASFIFLSRFCFNGLYRTNQAGRFNVPYGATGGMQLPTAAELRRVAGALSICTIKNSDFIEVLEETERGDFVYLDPPYAVGNRRVFKQYSSSSFGVEDLQRLAAGLRAIDRKGVAFVLSYALCSEAMRFFKCWETRRVYVQRNIAGFAEHRRRAGEVLISNCFPAAVSRN